MMIMTQIEDRNGMPYYVGSDGPVAVHAMNKVHLVNALVKAVRNFESLDRHSKESVTAIAVIDTLKAEVLKRMS